MSLAHRTSDGLTSTWSVLDHLYNVPKQLLPNMRRIKEMTFKNVPELLKRNISLNNIKNSHSILSLNLLFCKRFCLSQLLIAARYLLLDRSVHQLDTPAFILVIWVIVLRSLHTEQICYSVVDLGHSGALTSCNGLVKVRRLMLCRGDCISASPRGAVDLRQLESDLHHSAPPYHPLQLNKAPLQYPHFFPGVMRGI